MAGAPVGAAKPVIVTGGTAQSGGNITITLGADAAANDTFVLRVAPSTGDCEAATKAVGFNNVPTVAASGIAVDDLTVTTSDNCDGTLKNILTILFEDDTADNGDTITLSNIKYDVGADAAPGDLRFGVNGGGLGAAGSNATIARVDRIEGADRFATAAALAKAQGNGCHEEVIVVSGRNFPDALAASYLDKPILLVETSSVPNATRDAIKDVGASSVVIVGGDQAVSPGVATTIQGYDEGVCGDATSGKVAVKRIAGGTRYSTAFEVADELAGGTLEEGLDVPCAAAVKTVLLVSGQNFPDALAAGALSSQGSLAGGNCGTGRIPLLLTEPGSLSAPAEEYITSNAIKQVIIIGGTQAVSDAAEDDVDDLAGVTTIERIDGANRAATAKEVAEFLVSDIVDFAGTRAFVALGANFPDALVAGPMAGANEAPILLTTATNTLGAEAADFLEDNTPTIWATLLGGTTALTDAVRTQTGAAFLARN